ncbi:hypothetical protein [Mesomycoplasma hyopneumoniae]|uniref:hypothetical protein n=1 Tax=Mesomycoplasma hyopneumoniae TaxID=2099 RepID=UPI003877FB74
MQKKELIEKWVLFFNWKIRKNKLIFLLFSVFFLVFFIFLTSILLLEFDIKPFIKKNSKFIENVNDTLLIINAFLIFLLVFCIILLILLIWFGLESKKKYRQNHLFLKGLSLHFETEFIKTNFLIENKFWIEFRDFKEENGGKISKFDQFYNNTIIFSKFFLNKMSNFISKYKYNLLEIDIFANDFKLRDYKINYFEEVKKIHNNLFVLSTLSYIFLTLFWSAATVTIFKMSFQFSFFKNIRNDYGLLIEYAGIGTLIITWTLLSFAAVPFLFLRFNYLREYFIIFYKVFAIGFAEFEKVDNFEKNEEFKNSLYLAIKKGEGIIRPFDLDRDISNWSTGWGIFSRSMAKFWFWK